MRLRQIQQYIWSQHLDKTVRTIEFIDEAWHLLGQPESAQGSGRPRGAAAQIQRRGGAGHAAGGGFFRKTRGPAHDRAGRGAAVSQTARIQHSTRSPTLHDLAQEEKDALRMLQVGQFMMIAGGYRSILVKTRAAQPAGAV